MASQILMIQAGLLVYQ